MLQKIEFDMYNHAPKYFETKKLSNFNGHKRDTKAVKSINVGQIQETIDAPWTL